MLYLGRVGVRESVIERMRVWATRLACVYQPHVETVRAACYP